MKSARIARIRSKWTPKWERLVHYGISRDAGNGNEPNNNNNKNGSDVGKIKTKMCSLSRSFMHFIAV